MIVNSGPGYNDYLVISPSSSDFNNTIDDQTVHLAEPLYTDFGSAKSSFVVWGAGIISFGPPDPLQVAFMEAATGNPDAGVDLSGFPGAHISLGFQIDPSQIEIGFCNPGIVGNENAYTLIGFGPEAGITASVFIYADHIVVAGSIPGAEITLDGNTVVPLTDGTFDLRTLLSRSGTSANDDLSGGPEPATIHGLDGNDTFHQGSGAAILRGDGGEDTFYVDHRALGPTTIDGGAGRNHLVLDASAAGRLNYTIADGPGGFSLYNIQWSNVQDVDVIGGSDFDRIVGNAGNNKLDGGAGGDTLIGGAGNDVLIDGIGGIGTLQPITAYSGGANAPSLDNAFVKGSDGIPVAFLQPVIPEMYKLRDLYYRFYAAPGATLKLTSTSSAVCFAVSKIDGTPVYSDDGTNFALAGGEYFIDAYAGYSSGSPYYFGTEDEFAVKLSSATIVPDHDVLDGGTGDDRFYVNDPSTVVIERLGEGTDTIQSSVSYTLAGIFVETLQLTGTAAINATGNSKVNALIGNNAANVLDGLQGIDTLTGGAGADTFRFSVAPGAADADTITDFLSATDHIALAASVYTGLGIGALDPAAFRTGTAAAGPGDHVIYDAATGRLWFDVDGAGGVAQALIATLAPGTAFAAGDIVVV